MFGETSAQGISKAVTENPSLILTDLDLPDMIATEAITILKKNPVTSLIRFVVLTAESGREWRIKALKAGAVEYLLKPISRGDLVKIARKLCRDVPTNDVVKMTATMLSKQITLIG
jgi:CheY-like chemotaxis protein